MDTIIVADSSRTVRALVRLALGDLGAPLAEAGGAEELADALSAGAVALVAADEALLDHARVRAGLATASPALVVLSGGAGDAAARARAAGLAPDRVRVVHKPLSRQAVRDAVGGLIRAPAGPSVRPEELRELVRAEVERIAAAEVRAVAWRVVPELAERIIRDELQRLLKDGEEGT